MSEPLSPGHALLIAARDSLQAGADRIGQLTARIAALEAERDKLQAFKTWVHTYLDGKGVPHHPPGVHGADGCRIGDRIDWLMSRLAALAATGQWLDEELQKSRDLAFGVAMFDERSRFQNNPQDAPLVKSIDAARAAWQKVLEDL